MRKLSLGILAIWGSLAMASVAQQPNGLFAAMSINAPANLSVASPNIVPVFTDSQIDLHIKAFPAGPTPVVVYFATSFTAGQSRQINSVPFVNQFNFEIDVKDQGAAGFSDQEFVNGYTAPGSLSFTDAVGDLSIPVTIPACVVVNNVATCISQSTFEVTAQALVRDPTNSPFVVRSTGVSTATFTNGYQSYSLVGDGFGTFNFLGGFTFHLYGVAYTKAYLSANGYVSFGGTGAPTGFPDPSVTDIRTGPARIMSFYNDLVPETMTYSPRIYAQQFVENGPGNIPVRKIKFVHERLAEFSNQTGPHGGEIVITENDDIAVFVGAYNAQPSINTGVGITPGNSLGVNPTGFGKDLSALVNSGPSVLGAGVHGFELFDNGAGASATHLLDLAGFRAANGLMVGKGVVFFKDLTLPNTTVANSGYIIQ